MAVLISFSGLPGTGKSTVARALSRETGAVYLRIDAIDAAIWARDPDRDIGPESYHISAALAVSNLEIGHDTIVDCVNPWDLTRAIFTDAAMRAGARFLGVETRCSDAAVHRARIEQRKAEVPGLKLPDWQAVLDRDYTPWDTADVRLDTSRLGVADSVERITRTL